jgi:hypothetical protein
VPHRRLTALPLALIATAALAAGCEIDLKNADSSGVPVPFSVAPTPSASAGVPKYVCTAAYKILTDGAVRLAGYLNGTGDAAKQGMRDTFLDMAAKVTAEAERTTDPELGQALEKVAGDLTAGAREADPKAYADGGFQTVGQKLDAACDKA